MSRKPKDPQYIADIHALTLPELQLKYRKKNDPSKPTIKNQASLNVLRHKYRNELKAMNPEAAPSPDQNRLQKIAELLERSGIDPNDVQNVERANVWTGFIKNNDGEIEYADLSSVQFVPKKPEDVEFWQAESAKITPSRRRPTTRSYKSIFVFSDAQIDYRNIDEQYVPLHDERAMRVASLICADLQPDVIVNLGDTVDNAAFSRFKPDSTHFHNTMRRSHQRVHDFYAQLRADSPRARIVEVDSNHNVRPRNWMLQHMPQIYDMRQAGSNEEYPIWSYPFLANLKAVGVEWVGGYGAAEFHYADDLVFRHGNTAVSNGSTAAKVSKQEPEVNIVQGHAHRAETFNRTTRNGKYLASVVVGALCRTTGEVPSYHSAVDDKNQVVRHQEDWVQSVMEIQDYGDGNYQFNHIYIRDGRAFYNGKEYVAEGSHVTA